ncbi:hypothetical protein [Halalkalibacter hemicellulosilyticus]|uniref:DUF4129 domain-containing protein n=1 Tax=Halalkalibacter hemicellulosilyticusJCM 9152 TaxID=1236971 RepID=W4QES3_9BACI|nr:hypothetical protein [Halalkalibacter hemicellulosilyticus]GAE30595.1 hypothetical protein JCM9152_2007 [Halalkalibacter hemicellulosilyticusJCM 9152]
MRRNNHWRVLFTGALEYLMIFPIFLAISIFALSADIQAWWLYTLPLVFAIGYFIRNVRSDQKRIVYLAIILSISFVLPALLNHFISISMIVWIVLSIIYVTILYRGLAYGEEDIDDLFKAHYLWAIAFPLYFVGYFFYTNIDLLIPFTNTFQLAGFVVFVLTLFVSNSSMLRRATYSKEKRPVIGRSLRIQNRLFMLVTIITIVLLANFGFIREVLIMLRNGISSVVIFFLTFSSPNEEKEDYADPQLAESVLPFDETGEASFIAKFFEQMVIYLGIIAAGVLLIVALYFINRKIKSFIKNIILYLKKMMTRIISGDDSTDGVNIYVDEKENLFSIKKWVKSKTNDVKHVVATITERRVKWDSLSNVEKVRFIYRSLIHDRMKRGEVYRNVLTPRQMLHEVERQQLQIEKRFKN